MLRDLLDGHWSAPVVIGGTGGSGTRLVARLLREMGVELGAQVNGTEDALSFVPLYDRYVNPYLARGALDSAAFEADLLKAIREHRGPDAGKVWGWKNPRSIFLLPVLDGLIAGLKFVHVVRHGLDMALSSNQNQVRLHAAAALGAQCADLAPEMRAALLWKKANAIAADYASAMRDRKSVV